MVLLVFTKVKIKQDLYGFRYFAGVAPVFLYIKINKLINLSQTLELTIFSRRDFAYENTDAESCSGNFGTHTWHVKYI